MNYFYNRIIKIESLISELDSLVLSYEEKMRLATLIDDSLHNTILDAILSELSEEDKRIFLEHLHNNDHSKIWKLLNNKVDGVEEKIKMAASDIKIELEKDLKYANRIQQEAKK